MALGSPLEAEISNFEQQKSRLKVTIYGSYGPTSLSRLKALKECLIGRGYANTRLVMDYNTPVRQKGETDEQYWTRKSIDWIMTSDVNIFALFCGSDLASTGFEIGRVSAADVTHSKTMILFERKCYKKFGSLLRGAAQHPPIQWNKFTADADACQFSANKCQSVIASPIL
jgi:hypothetical protein